MGNVDLFPDSTLLIQKAEVDWAFGDGKPAPFKRDRPMKLLTGDLDVFGDGSATLLSTPGHTPGHQSFLVHLDKTGWLLLTGDAAHFKDNWDNDRVPSMNTCSARQDCRREKGGALGSIRFAHFRQPQAFSRFLRVTSIVPEVRGLLDGLLWRMKSGSRGEG